MIDKEKKESQKRLNALNLSIEDEKKHLSGLEAINKYLEITLLENNTLKDVKQIKFDSPINNNSVILVVFKLNNKVIEFKFTYRKNLAIGRNYQEEVKKDFAQKFTQFIYDQLFKVIEI